MLYRLDEALNVSSEGSYALGFDVRFFFESAPAQE